MDEDTDGKDGKVQEGKEVLIALASWGDSRRLPPPNYEDLFKADWK